MPIKRSSIPLLSKSRFMAGLQCPKRLWLDLYKPDLATDLDAGTQLILDQGTLVGQLARGYYDGGLLVDEDHFHHPEAVARTADALADKSHPAIYEAAFLHDDVRVRVDLLARAPKGAFDLIEVKSSTQVKVDYLWDVAIQVYVVRGAGTKLRRVFVMTIDNRYIYPGGPHDPKKLFKLEDVTEDVEALLPQVPGLLQAMRKPLWQTTVPDIEVGDHCYAPHECQFISYCHPPGPDHPVSELYRAGGKLRNRLAADGIGTISDIPSKYSGLSDIQARMRDSVVTGQPYIDRAIGPKLQALVAPIFFLDFETISPAVPLYAGTRPFQVIPFQWSVHRLGVGDTVQHFEHLHNGQGDPRPDLLASLLDVLGHKGAVCVYSSYEDTQLKLLGEAFPDQGSGIDAVRERIVDLLPLVREHVYHPEFHGSFSIKNVYPALIPGSSYDDLDIADGGAASAAFMTILAQETAEPERRLLRKSLLDYCKRDTEALAELYGALRKLN